MKSDLQIMKEECCRHLICDECHLKPMCDTITGIDDPAFWDVRKMNMAIKKLRRKHEKGTNNVQQ